MGTVGWLEAKAMSWVAGSSAAVSLPHVIVPSAVLDTRRPLRPRYRCSTCAMLRGDHRLSLAIGVTDR